MQSLVLPLVALFALSGCAAPRASESQRPALQWRAPDDADQAYSSLLADLARKFWKLFPEDEPGTTFVVYPDPMPLEDYKDGDWTHLKIPEL